MTEYLPPPLPDAGPRGMAPNPEAALPPSRRPALIAIVAAIVVAIAAVGGTLLLLRSGGDKSKLDPGWKRVAAEAEGFSVGMPPAWKAVSTTDADKAFEALQSANPQLANLVKDQLGGSLSSLIKLLAFDTKSPTLAQQFATNMNVVVAPAAGVPIETFLEQNLVPPQDAGAIERRVEETRTALGPGGIGHVTTDRERAGRGATGGDHPISRRERHERLHHVLLNSALVQADVRAYVREDRGNVPVRIGLSLRADERIHQRNGVPPGDGDVHPIHAPPRRYRADHMSQ